MSLVAGSAVQGGALVTPAPSPATPCDAPVKLRARVVESTEDRAVAQATLESGGRVCATCRGTFVAVKLDQPAYHRW